MILRPLALALFTVAALAACSQPQRAGNVAAVDTMEAVPASAGFDRPRAGTLGQEAERDAAAGRLAEARGKAREAALLWPADVAAWNRLAELSAQLGDRTDARAARFIAARAELYATDDLAMQRQVAPALDRVAQGQTAASATAPASDELAALTPSAAAPPGVEPYAAALASFYRVEYAKRGRLADPGRQYFVLEGREVPAAVLTGGLIGSYLLGFSAVR